MTRRSTDGFISTKLAKCRKLSPIANIYVVLGEILVFCDIVNACACYMNLNTWLLKLCQ